MFIANRSLGEAIVIGDEVVVQVMELAQNRVWLAVSAPRDFPISRKETLDALSQPSQGESSHDPGR